MMKQMNEQKSMYMLPIMSGILLISIQPPLTLFLLAFVAVIPLMLSLDGASTLKGAFMRGYVSGIVSYLGLVYWVVVAMNRFGGVHILWSIAALLLMVSYLAIYTGIFTGAVYFFERRVSVPAYLSAPVLWILLEYLRGTLLTGFPWSFIAHSQQNFLSFIQIISVTGTYFLSFLIVAVNSVIYCYWKKKPISIAYTIAIGCLVAISIVYGMIRLSEPVEERFKVALIQGNIAQDIKWNAEMNRKTVQIYYDNTIKEAGSDFIVWPETALPFIIESSEKMMSFMRSVPVMASANLLVGAVAGDERGRLYNAAYIFNKNGEIAGVYKKVHLVPFGEYTPFQKELAFLEKMSVAVGAFFPGPSHRPIETGMGKIGVLICYEGVFPSITVETVRSGAQVLVNITNDAWYERTSAAYQHLGFYVFRAIESDRYMLRSANTGISAVIDPRGRITGRTELFTEVNLRGRFSMRNTITPYVRYGDYFLVLATAFLFLCVISALFRLRRKNNGSR